MNLKITKTNILLVFCLFFVLETVSSETNCSQQKENQTVDLRDELGPIRNQDGSNWCYAFVAADLLGHQIGKTDSKFLINKKEDQVSAVWMGLMFNKKKRSKRYHEFKKEMSVYYNMSVNSEELENSNPGISKNISRKILNPPTPLIEKGGFVLEDLEQIDEQNICLESEISSYDYGDSVIFSNLITNKKFKNALAYYQSSNDLLKQIFYQTAKNNYNNNYDSCMTSTFLQMVFPNLELNDISEALSKKMEENNDPLSSLVLKSCHLSTKLNGDNSLPKETVVNFNGKEKVDVFKHINEALDQGNPVAIGYRPEVFEFGGRLLRNRIRGSRMGHASVLVGKSFNCKSGKLEYILRNSWGKDSCESSRGKFEDPAISALVKSNNISVLDCRGICQKNKKTDDCHNACIDDYREKDKEIVKESQKRAPYRCENGYYIFEKSLIEKDIYEATSY